MQFQSFHWLSHHLGRSQGGSWGVLGCPWPPLCKPFCKQTAYNIQVTIWWVLYVWISVTPPLKNPGYAHGHHGIWAIIPCLCKHGKQTRDFWGAFISSLVDFSIFWRRFFFLIFHSRFLDMRLVIANSALRAPLPIYHLIYNARSWNNC